MLDRGGHGASATALSGIQHSVDGPGQSGRAAGLEGHLRWADAEPGRDDLAGAREQRAGATALRVEAGGSAQPASSAATRVSRATGWSGPGGRVEDGRPRGADGGLFRHADNVIRTLPDMSGGMAVGFGKWNDAGARWACPFCFVWRGYGMKGAPGA